MSGTELDYVRDAFESIERLESLDDFDAIRDEIYGRISTWGFSYFAISRLPQPNERISPHMLVKIWPAQWLLHYDRSRYYRSDPVVHRCAASAEPFMWSDVAADAPRASTGYRIMNEAAEHGMRDGFCIPIHGADAFQGGISMAGERVELPPNARRALHLLGLYAWGAAERIDGRRHEADRRRLSSREREVIRWVALGKKAHEVSDILGLSETTVRTHLDRSREKLGTRNATRTAIEALRRREISL